MHERIVFLDIDGVCNTYSWRAPPVVGSMESSWFRDKLRNLNPDLVVRLNGIDAEFVLSSSWRYLVLDDLNVMQRLLEARGFTGKLISRTRTGEGFRGYQINDWLLANPTRAFVIVDDNSDMAHLIDQLVQIDGKVGITDADVARINAKLGVTIV